MIYSALFIDRTTCSPCGGRANSGYCMPVHVWIVLDHMAVKSWDAERTCGRQCAQDARQSHHAHQSGAPGAPVRRPRRIGRAEHVAHAKPGANPSRTPIILTTDHHSNASQLPTSITCCMAPPPETLHSHTRGLWTCLEMERPIKLTLQTRCLVGGGPTGFGGGGAALPHASRTLSAISCAIGDNAGFEPGAATATGGLKGLALRSEAPLFTALA